MFTAIRRGIEQAGVRRYRVVLLLFIVAICAASLGGVRPVAAAQSGTVTLSTPSGAWVDTGVNLRAYQLYTISAQGNFTYSNSWAGGAFVCTASTGSCGQFGQYNILQYKIGLNGTASPAFVSTFFSPGGLSGVGDPIPLEDVGKRVYVRFYDPGPYYDNNGSITVSVNGGG